MTNAKPLLRIIRNPAHDGLGVVLRIDVTLVFLETNLGETYLMIKDLHRNSGTEVGPIVAAGIGAGVDLSRLSDQHSSSRRRILRFSK
jgi:hypothetical protein